MVFAVASSVGPAERRVLLEQLWGVGFARPNSISLLEELIAPIVSTLGVRVLDLSPGFGGESRRLINSFGFQVTVSDKYTTPLAVEAGSEVQVVSIDLENDRLPSASYDCVVMCEDFCILNNKIDVLGKLRETLKPEGHLFLLDCVLGRKRDSSGRLGHWLSEGKKQPWNLRQFEISLEGVGFDLHSIKDVSEQYKKLVLLGWSAYLPELKREGLSQAGKREVLAEAERWFSVLSFLNNQSLQICRFHAVRK